jgi:hypothetical protein
VRGNWQDVRKELGIEAAFDLARGGPRLMR